MLEAEGRADEAEDKVSEHIDISRLEIHIHIQRARNVNDKREISSVTFDTQIVVF